MRNRPRSTYAGFKASVAEYAGADVCTITDETRLVADLKLDNAGFIWLAAHLKAIYEVHLKASELRRAGTVGQVYLLLGASLRRKT